jgi:hypothetical protein
MSAIVTSTASPKYISAEKMIPGQVGTFFYLGEKVIALRTYGELVDLNRPLRTWLLTASFEIELLPEGSTVELTVESSKAKKPIVHETIPTLPTEIDLELEEGNFETDCDFGEDEDRDFDEDDDLDPVY